MVIISSVERNDPVELLAKEPGNKLYYWFPFANYVFVPGLTGFIYR